MIYYLVYSGIIFVYTLRSNLICFYFSIMQLAVAYNSYLVVIVSIEVPVFQTGLCKWCEAPREMVA